MIKVLGLTLLALFAHPKHWTEPTEPFRIVGPIHYVGTKGLGVYLITTNEGHILLSGAMPESTPLLTNSIEKLGFQLKDIKLLLTSHAHVDHVGTLADMKKLTGAPLAVMEGDVDLLESGGKKDYLFANDPSFHFQPVTPDHILKDGETVTLGGISLVAHWTPGHTRGCTTWEMAVENYKVIFPDGTSVNPGTQFGSDPSYPGITEDYKKTFSVLESLKPDIFLSYHAEFFDLEGKRERMAKEGVNAWVDPDGYKRLIARKKTEFEKLISTHDKS